MMNENGSTNKIKYIPKLHNCIMHRYD